MTYQEIVNLIFGCIVKYGNSFDFQNATNYLEDIVHKLSREETISLINQIGVIPERIGHDSKEEKLYSKLSEILLSKCFMELGLKSKTIVTRSDSADVVAQSIYHGYSVVADAKAFRLSRTAKNQKDFKVDSLSHWRGGNDYAVLCCPYFQYPKTRSAIYKQSLENNVSLLSWEFFAYLLENKQKESVSTNLNFLWKFPIVRSNCTVFNQANENYFNEQNDFFDEYLCVDKGSFFKYLASAKSTSIKRCLDELTYWNDEKAKIEQYTKEEAIKGLIEAKKINQKIETIELFKLELEQ